MSLAHQQQQRDGGEPQAAARRGMRPSAASLATLSSLIGNRAMGRLQRAPKNKVPPQVDPRAAPGHRDPLIKVPAAGPPLIEQVTEEARAISWSWEVERPGTAGAPPFREQIYWANFEVDAQGVMRVSARMVSASGQFRAPEWSLREKFKEALETFRLGGVDVRAFEAEWGYMGPGEISGNLDAFFGQLKAQPGKQVEAARVTPSGKVAIENGFTEAQIVSDPGYEPSEVSGNTGARQSRPVVRVRFSLPGPRADDPVLDTPGGSPTAPAGITTPGVAKVPPTFTTGQRVTGTVALIAMGANIALNSWIAHENDAAIQRALDAQKKDLQAEQEQAPTLGFLLAFHFSGAVDSREGPTATGSFKGISWTRGTTRPAAEANWSSMDPAANYEFAWIDPIDVSALVPPGWHQVALGKFADISSVEFQGMGFRQHSVAGDKGFFTKRRISAGSGAAYPELDRELRFFVLGVPSPISYYGAGRQQESVEIKSEDAYVIGGYIPTMSLDGDAVVPVVAANAKTHAFFEQIREGIIDDKEKALATVGYIEHVRWLPVDQVEAVTLLDSSYQRRTDQARADTIKHMREQVEGHRGQQ